MKRVLFVLAVIIFANLCVFLFYLKRLNKGDDMKRFASALDELIQAERIRNDLVDIAAHPHVAGSEMNRLAGDRIIEALKNAGLKVQSDEHTVQLYELRKLSVEMTYPEKKSFPQHEAPVSADSYTAIAAGRTAYFAYAPDVNLEAEVVYANYGAPEDYEILKQKGIEPAGKIALVRAQGLCRGMKIRAAQDAGVAALLLYPEIKDQGFRKPEYPNGTHLHPATIQRGSLLPYFQQPGNDCVQPDNLPRIAAIPVSPQTATSLFNSTSGDSAPSDWQGQMNVEYRIGRNLPKVRIDLDGEIVARTIRNITARIQGSTQDPAVLVGAHYDAWEYGANDPVSAVAVVLETARVLQQLHRSSPPARSIVFAFWDAEEFGMFGSSEWVEKNQVRSAPYALYVNVDAAVRSRDFNAYVVPGLQYSVDRALNHVIDPQTDRPVSDTRRELRLPGFSSDTAVLMGEGGIPTADFAFGQSYSLYHSLYDTPYYFENFADNKFRYSSALTKFLALYTIQFAAPGALPYRFAELPKFVFAQLNDMNDPELQMLYDVASSFEEKAIRFDQRLEKGTLAGVNLNSLMLQAYRLFLINEESREFVLNNPLLGPSSSGTCETEGLPLLRRAIKSGDSEQKTREVRRLVSIFQKAGETLDLLMNANN